MEEAQELSDRVGIIDHGELIALGSLADLTRRVGQSETLILHVGEGESVEAIAALVVAVRGLEGVLNADAAGQRITVIAAQAEEILAPAVTLANAHGIRIRSVDIREPNLEAVFLHLTGRALRD
jgi:ABC-2 type transport system ATP-binding protein